MIQFTYETPKEKRYPYFYTIFFDAGNSEMLPEEEPFGPFTTILLKKSQILSVPLYYLLIKLLPQKYLREQKKAKPSCVDLAFCFYKR